MPAGIKTSDVDVISSQGNYDGRQRPTELTLLLENLRDVDLSGDLYDESAYLNAHGGYCDVFTAKSRKHGNITVAVKRIRIHILHDKDVSKESQIILRELRIWSTLDHLNVLPLLGYAMHGSYPALVSKWMVNGPIMKYLRDFPDTSVILMARGIAEGLSYLHVKNVVHSDLKSDNILISDAGEPLLADFGISRCMTTTSMVNTTTGVTGSARWVAIELLTPSTDEAVEVGKHTMQTDVWAFGMVIYELLTMKMPFFHLKNDLLVSIAIAGGQTPSVPTSIDPKLKLLWSMCESCWMSNPSRRPRMEEICDVFKEKAMSILSPGSDVRRTSNPLRPADVHKPRPFPIDTLGLEKTMNQSDIPFQGSTVVWNRRTPRGGNLFPVLHADGREVETAWHPRTDWTKGEMIGWGTYTRVYLALKVGTNTPIAAKQIAMLNSESSTGITSLANVANSLKLENDVLEELDHPNIVQYLGYEQTHNFFTLFMEFVPSASLASCLRERGKLEDQISRSFIGQILGGLEYLHGVGIVHRDLKSENVLLEPSGVCKISEFGVSKRMKDVNKNGIHRPVVGGMFWRPPEVAGAREGEEIEYSGKLDIWSLGCIALQIWTGDRPRQSEEATSKSNPPRAPSIPNDLILSADAEDFRQNCLRINPKERPSATELRKHTYLTLRPGWTFNGFK